MFWETKYATVLSEYQRFKTEAEMKYKEAVRQTYSQVEMVVNLNEDLKARYLQREGQIEELKRQLRGENKELKESLRNTQRELLEARDLLTYETDRASKLQLNVDELNSKINSMSIQMSPHRSPGHEPRPDLEYQIRYGKCKIKAVEAINEELREKYDQLLQNSQQNERSHELEAAKLKSQIKMYEEVIDLDRKEFQAKFTEIQSILKGQQTYMADIDKHMLQQEDQIRTSKSQAAQHIGQIVSETNVMLSSIQEQLDKSKAETTKIQREMEKSAAATTSLKHQLKKFNFIINKFTKRALDTITTLDNESMHWDSTRTTFDSRGGDEQEHTHTKEISWEEAEEKLHRVLVTLRTFKDDCDSRRNQLINRTDEISAQLQQERIKSATETSDHEKRSKDLLNTIRLLSEKLVSTRKKVKKLHSASHSQELKSSSLTKPLLSQPSNEATGADGDVKDTQEANDIKMRAVPLAVIQAQSDGIARIMQHIDKVNNDISNIFKALDDREVK